MTDNKISFAQVNIGHRKIATAELNKIELDSNTFVILVQEPYLKRNLIANLDPRRFNILSHIGKEKIRSCILSSKNCNILPLRQFCSGDITAALLKFAINAFAITQSNGSISVHAF